MTYGVISTTGFILYVALTTSLCRAWVRPPIGQIQKGRRLGERLSTMIQECVPGPDALQDGPRSALYPGTPCLPIIVRAQETVTQGLKRPRRPRSGPAEMPTLEDHPSVGMIEVDMTMHAEHRRKLIARMRDIEGVPARSILLFRGGQSTLRHETDHEHLFRQESTFHYLFGVREPDCLGVINLETEEATLYIPRLPEEFATWMGPINPPSHYQVIV